MEIGIIGGGPSGMMAAITASESGTNHVTLFERHNRLGRKLAVTGNGRCNLSNSNLSIKNYHGNTASFPQNALNAFTAKDTIEFFNGLGLLTVTESNGKIYPYTDQANSVVDVLRFALSRKNVEIKTATDVQAVRRSNRGFSLQTTGGVYECDKLIVAAGGLAGTAYGGSLSGYNILRSFGHHCTKLTPALVQLVVHESFVKGLKGIRANASVKLSSGDAVIDRASGEVQFTEYGLSGPAVFEVSREAAKYVKSGCCICLDLLPDYPEEKLISALCIRVSQYPDLLCGDLLTGFLQNRLGRVLLHINGISENTKISSLGWNELTNIAKSVHHLVFSVKDTMGMESAQVTAGGICTDEFSSTTLESKIIPGLYAAGEVLDVDGDCGGYNLQWAWASGKLAGQLKGRIENAENS